MQFPLKLARSSTFRVFYRRSSSVNSPQIIKVFSSEEDQNVKISFKYAHFNHFNLKAPKSESVQNLLNRIKYMAAYQHKKEEIRQSVYNPSFKPELKSNSNKLIDVCLLENDIPVDDTIPNGSAWAQASALKVGETLYKIKYNMPTVIELSLPDYIISGCPIRPHFITECANFDDTLFRWYRSMPKEDVLAIDDGKIFKNSSLTPNENVTIDDSEISLKNSRLVPKEDGTFINDSEMSFKNEQYWQQVGEGFVHFVSSEDVGNRLKVVCIPRLNNSTGCEFSAESKSAVEAAPELFPFDERQSHTKSFCDNYSIRCVSYNILANMYVERKKFPYSSEKARDNYYRKQVLIRELIGYNSDIICLQEVQDRLFEFDLVPVLKKLGYVGSYNRKGGRRFEGLAMFVHSSKFKILKEYGVMLNQVIKKQDIYTDLLNKVARNYEDMSKLLLQHTVLQVSLLQNIHHPELQVLVANTHLYSNKDNPEVRLIQAAVCTHYIEHIIKSENLESVPMLFCGDFNSLPDSETVNFMMDGKYECCPSWHKDSHASADTILRHNLTLDSACGAPEYTNFTEDFQGCLDYIFYSRDLLKVSQVVPMPSHEHVVASVALPSELFPSDHIALICTLQWNKS
ncbi:hypothetical protein JTE90_027164 [Oedothorax gibbosus]|uniref:2',5'-phosphodiesterase 12 n=1 Tax=Oedothorax gibbosus TaxID=931172 RepID=A0AAV6TXZ6_9ARAC|nr:hypothetical protein JTE90_027164 [Oedothorax gibbosus]